MKTALLFLLLSLAPFAWCADEGAAPPFVLTVVPSRSSAKGRTITFGADKVDEFYVVLSNTSKDAQPVFEYWNSWGCGAITFELTTSDGKAFTVGRRPEAFTMNYPSTFLIPAAEQQVYAIRLDKRWVMHPKLGGDTEIPVSLKAIYRVGSTPEATKNKVWVGRVESKSYDLTLWRLRKDESE